MNFIGNMYWLSILTKYRNDISLGLEAEQLSACFDKPMECLKSGAGQQFVEADALDFIWFDGSFFARVSLIGC
jgi:hypothetical protein